MAESRKMSLEALHAHHHKVTAAHHRAVAKLHEKHAAHHDAMEERFAGMGQTQEPSKTSGAYNFQNQD